MYMSLTKLYAAKTVQCYTRQVSQNLEVLRNKHTQTLPLW